MARNIEIKAKVDDLDTLRLKVATLTGAPPAVFLQTDTFFVVGSGRLKLRQFSDGRGELISYKRPDDVGPKESTYLRYRCPEPSVLCALLAQSLGVRGVVEKRREVFLAGRSRIHLDEVRGLGAFMEIEVVLEDGEPAAAGERQARLLMVALGIPESSLVGGAYLDLLAQA